MSLRLLRCFSIALGCLIAIGSLATALDFRGTLAVGRKITIFGVFHSTPHHLIHFLAFGLLALLARLPARTLQQRLVGLAAPICLGFAIELFQSFTNVHGFEFLDLQDDIVAALAGYVLGEGCLFAAFLGRKQTTRARLSIDQ
jgi:hypothetical protein